MRDAVGSVQSVLLLGGTSDIGLDIVRALVADRARTVVLAARDPERARQAGLGAEATVEAVELDATRLDTHEALLRARRPSTTACVTFPGSTAPGAASRSAVIFVRTKPGRTIITSTPLPWSESCSPRANASAAALEAP